MLANEAKEWFQGKLITFEGIEGVGKSTHHAYAVEFLKSQGVDVVATREPGGTEIAEAIRTVLLDHYSETMQAETELLLLCAARAQHVATVIKPALEQGKCVLCDRFIDASYAYQGGGRGLPMQDIAQLEQFVLKGLQPDLTLVFFAPVAIGLQRARGHSTGDRIEQEKQVFFERVQQIYLARAKQNPQRYRLLDAKQTVPEIQAELQELLTQIVALA